MFYGYRLSGASDHVGIYGASLVFSTFIWLAKILLLKYMLKLLLMYHGWMYEARGKISIHTKLWLVRVVKLSIRSIVSRAGIKSLLSYVMIQYI